MDGLRCGLPRRGPQRPVAPRPHRLPPHERGGHPQRPHRSPCCRRRSGSCTRARGLSSAALPPAPSPTRPPSRFPRDISGLYRQTKHLAELEVQAFVGRGLDVVVVNPTVIVGPGDAKPTPTGRMVRDYAAGRMPFFVTAHLNLVDVDGRGGGPPAGVGRRGSPARAVHPGQPQHDHGGDAGGPGAHRRPPPAALEAAPVADSGRGLCGRADRGTAPSDESPRSRWRRSGTPSRYRAVDSSKAIRELSFPQTACGGVFGAGGSLVPGTAGPPQYNAREGSVGAMVQVRQRGVSEDLERAVSTAVQRSQDYFLRTQHPEGYWWGELESIPTMEAEFILPPSLPRHRRPRSRSASWPTTSGESSGTTAPGASTTAPPATSARPSSATSP